jgi:hypothetical protein
MRFTRLVSACGLAAWLAVGAVAQEPKPADPPVKFTNATPGTFRSFIVLDQRTDPKDPKGKRNVTGFEHDLIVANELNPTVAVFSRSDKPDEATAKLVAKLKELTATYKTLDFGAYLFFPVLGKVYADDPKAKATADALKAWGEEAKAGAVVIGLSEKDSAQTKAWTLPETGTVIVFYHKHKVVKRWDLPDGGITDDVLNALTAAVNAELKK